MELGRRSALAMKQMLWNRFNSSQLLACQQCRCYRPPGMSRFDKQKLDRVRKPFIPDEATMPHLQEWQKSSEAMKRYKREAWAKFGSASGVDVRDILPTQAEIEEEWEAEKEWWPTLHEMQREIKEENEKGEQQRLAREKRIAENMAKMPKWIEQWKEEQEKQKLLLRNQQDRRNSMKERALEELDYKIDPDSKEFKDYLRDYMQRERDAKKKAKKLAQQMKRQ